MSLGERDGVPRPAPISCHEEGAASITRDTVDRHTLAGAGETNVHPAHGRPSIDDGPRVATVERGVEHSR